MISFSQIAIPFLLYLFHFLLRFLAHRLELLLLFLQIAYLNLLLLVLLIQHLHFLLLLMAVLLLLHLLLKRFDLGAELPVFFAKKFLLLLQVLILKGEVFDKFLFVSLGLEG